MTISMSLRVSMMYKETDDITELKNRARNYVIIAGSILLLTLLLMMYTSTIWLVVLALLAIYPIIMFTKVRDLYKEKIKSLTIAQIFSDYFDNIKYDLNQGFPEEQVEFLDLFNVGQSYVTNDFISGCHKDIRFTRSDVNTWTTYYTGKTTVTITYFHGQVFEFDFFKPKDSILKLTSRSSNIFKSFGNKNLLEALKFEDDEFNQMFHSFSNNDLDAYYIMTPHYMEKVKNLTQFIYDDFVVLFHNSKVYIAIFNREDKMEPKMSSGIDATYLEEINDSANFIKILINTLQLDQDY